MPGQFLTAWKIIRITVLRMISTRPQKRKNFRQPLVAKLLRSPLEQLLAVAHSLFESAEYPAMEPAEANSKRSPNSPSVDRQRAKPRLLVEISQSRERS